MKTKETNRVTKVDDKLARAEAEHAHDPERAELVARGRRFRTGWYELAEGLAEVRRSERYKRWGYPDFEDYCKRELHLRKDTVDKLTGAVTFLRKKAPDALKRDGRDAPIPSYQSVDFWRRAEEESTAPEDTLREIRRHVVDEGTSLPKLSRLYRDVVFPVDKEEQTERHRGALKGAIDKVVELLAIARDDGTVPGSLASEVEESLARLSAHVQASTD